MRVVRKELVMRSIERLHMQWSSAIVAIAAAMVRIGEVRRNSDCKGRYFTGLHEPKNEPVKSTTDNQDFLAVYVEFSMPG